MACTLGVKEQAAVFMRYSTPSPWAAVHSLDLGNVGGSRLDTLAQLGEADGRILSKVVTELD